LLDRDKSILVQTLLDSRYFLATTHIRYLDTVRDQLELIASTCDYDARLDGRLRMDYLALLFISHASHLSPSAVLSSCVTDTHLPGLKMFCGCAAPLGLSLLLAGAGSREQGAGEQEQEQGNMRFVVIRRDSKSA
jgi:hypothetical protein